MISTNDLREKLQDYDPAELALMLIDIIGLESIDITNAFEWDIDCFAEQIADHIGFELGE